MPIYVKQATYDDVMRDRIIKDGDTVTVGDMFHSGIPYLDAPLSVYDVVVATWSKTPNPDYKPNDRYDDEPEWNIDLVELSFDEIENRALKNESFLGEVNRFTDQLETVKKKILVEFSDPNLLERLKKDQNFVSECEVRTPTVATVLDVMNNWDDPTDQETHYQRLFFMAHQHVVDLTKELPDITFLWSEIENFEINGIS